MLNAGAIVFQAKKDVFIVLASEQGLSAA